MVMGCSSITCDVEFSGDNYFVLSYTVDDVVYCGVLLKQTSWGSTPFGLKEEQFGAWKDLYRKRAKELDELQDAKEHAYGVNNRGSCQVTPSLDAVVQSTARVGKPGFRLRPASILCSRCKSRLDNDERKIPSILDILRKPKKRISLPTSNSSKRDSTKAEKPEACPAMSPRVIIDSSEFDNACAEKFRLKTPVIRIPNVPVIKISCGSGEAKRTTVVRAPPSVKALAKPAGGGASDRKSSATAKTKATGVRKQPPSSRGGSQPRRINIKRPVKNTARQIVKKAKLASPVHKPVMKNFQKKRPNPKPKLDQTGTVKVGAVSKKFNLDSSADDSDLATSPDPIAHGGREIRDASDDCEPSTSAPRISVADIVWIETSCTSADLGKVVANHGLDSDVHNVVTGDVSTIPQARLSDFISEFSRYYSCSNGNHAYQSVVAHTIAAHVKQTNGEMARFGSLHPICSEILSNLLSENGPKQETSGTDSVTGSAAPAKTSSPPPKKLIILPVRRNDTRLRATKSIVRHIADIPSS